MAQLRYFAIASLDGYIEDVDGDFGWAAPTVEVHQFVNDLVRPTGTILYGRRMYETMVGWENDPSLAASGEVERDFAEIWQAADKVVFSRTLEAASTARTTIERTFDPDAVRALTAASDRDVTIGGPTLAAHAFAAGLIDRVDVVLVPVSIGAGKAALPTDRRLDLGLVEQRSFADGAVHLRYDVRST